MWTTVVHIVQAWSEWYADSAAIRSGVGFLHVAGLVIGGGAAMVEDRAILRAGGRGVTRRRSEVRVVERAAHGTVVTGLAVVVFSGLLLFAADAETFLYSLAFWIKMTLVAALIVNGWVLSRAELAVDCAEGEWPRLRRAAAVSLALWLMTMLAGSVLPNV